MKPQAIQIILAALQPARSGELGIDKADDDADAGDFAQRLELWRPELVLKRRLGDQCRAALEQQLNRVEECFVSLPGDLIARHSDQAGGVDQPFLDLITADPRAPDRLR